MLTVAMLAGIVCVGSLNTFAAAYSSTTLCDTIYIFRNIFPGTEITGEQNYSLYATSHPYSQYLSKHVDLSKYSTGYYRFVLHFNGEVRSSGQIVPSADVQENKQNITTLNITCTHANGNLKSETVNPTCLPLLREI